LGRAESVKSFLLHDDARFGPQLLACAAQARLPLSALEREKLFEQIHAAIAPIDVAGLSDRQRRNWHPALASDLMSAAHKLGVTKEAIAEMLQRCGFSDQVQHIT
jgi:hypothetical protein